MPELTLIRATAISLTVHLVFAILTLAVGALAIRLIDRYFFRAIDLEEEIAKGNLAAAVLAGSLWLSLAIILVKSG